jgi:hypothetical protein
MQRMRFPDSMAAKRLLVLAGLLLLALPLAARAGVTEDEETLKRDAVKRLTDSNDPALEVNIGRVYVKQAALKAARDLLEERGGSAGLTRERWNLQVPEWQAAERELMQGVDQLIAVKVADGKWVREAWAQLVSGRFKSEEADEIAVHFQTEGGDWQRRTVEWFVGELTLQTYTFTDRLKYGVPGSEAEMRDLQEVTYERMMTRGIHDFTKYPDAMRFATVGLGPEYFKMMAMQGVHVVHVHLEAVADEARASIRSRAALADPYIAQVRARAGN